MKPASFYVWSGNDDIALFWTGSKARMSQEYPDRLAVGTYKQARLELAKAKRTFSYRAWEIMRSYVNNS
jgi:hypothetical protein